jgi:hypothetical protein
VKRIGGRTDVAPEARIGVVMLVDRLSIGGAERLAAKISMRLDFERYASTLCI